MDIATVYYGSQLRGLACLLLNYFLSILNFIDSLKWNYFISFLSCLLLVCRNTVDCVSYMALIYGL